MIPFFESKKCFFSKCLLSVDGCENQLNGEMVGGQGFLGLSKLIVLKGTSKTSLETSKN